MWRGVGGCPPPHMVVGFQAFAFLCSRDLLPLPLHPTLLLPDDHLLNLSFTDSRTYCPAQRVVPTPVAAECSRCQRSIV